MKKQPVLPADLVLPRLIILLFPCIYSEGSISEFEIFPLVAREHLTEEEHSSVLQKMVNGAIAHREDIIA